MPGRGASSSKSRSTTTAPAMKAAKTARPGSGTLVGSKPGSWSKPVTSASNASTTADAMKAAAHTMLERDGSGSSAS
jgi:hypothetical protein